MSSGRDSWQNEPASIKPGRFRAHHSSNQTNNNLSSSSQSSSSSSTSTSNSNLPLPINSNQNPLRSANQHYNYSAAPSSRQQPFYSNFFSNPNQPNRSNPNSNSNSTSNQNQNLFAPSFAPAAARRKERLRNRVDSTRPNGAGGSGFRRNGQPKKRSWALNLFRPTREVVEITLESWWKRWGVLAIAPSFLVSISPKREGKDELWKWLSKRRGELLL